MVKLLSTAIAPRHLKKAWLQRHTTGEDCESTALIIASNPISISAKSVITTGKIQSSKDICEQSTTSTLETSSAVGNNKSYKKPGIFNVITKAHQILSFQL